MTEHIKQRADIVEDLHPDLERAMAGSLSVDLWMSRMNQGAIGSVFNHLDNNFSAKETVLGLVQCNSTTADGVKKNMKVVLDDYGLNEKLICITTDEGPNLTGTRSTYTEGSNPFFETILENPCFTHFLSNACRKACKIQDFQRAEKQIIAAVSYTQSSGKGAELLMKAQADKRISQRRLKKHVATRFGSTVLMFRSAMENKQAIDYMFSDLVPEKYKSRAITQADWNTIEITCLVLKPIVKLLQISQANTNRLNTSTALTECIRTYVYLMQVEKSDMVSACSRLSENFQGAESSNENIRLSRIAREIQESLACEFFAYLEPFRVLDDKKQHFWIAPLLDPRFKDGSILIELC